MRSVHVQLFRGQKEGSSQVSACTNNSFIEGRKRGQVKSGQVRSSQIKSGHANFLSQEKYPDALCGQCANKKHSACTGVGQKEEPGQVRSSQIKSSHIKSNQVSIL